MRARIRGIHWSQNETLDNSSPMWKQDTRLHPGPFPTDTGSQAQPHTQLAASLKLAPFLAIFSPMSTTSPNNCLNTFSSLTKQLTVAQKNYCGLRSYRKLLSIWDLPRIPNSHRALHMSEYQQLIFMKHLTICQKVC